jgi:hypothetical protein
MGKPFHYKGALGEFDMYFTMRQMYRLQNYIESLEEYPRFDDKHRRISPKNNLFKWLELRMTEFGDETASEEDVLRFIKIGCEMAAIAGITLDADNVFDSLDYSSLNVFLLSIVRAILSAMITDTESLQSVVKDLTLEKAREEESELNPSTPAQL